MDENMTHLQVAKMIQVNWIKTEDDASKPTIDGEYVTMIKSPQYGDVKMVLRYDSVNDDWYAGVEPYDVCMNSRVTHWLNGL